MAAMMLPVQMWAAKDTTKLQIVDISRFGSDVQVVYDLPLRRPAADYKVTIQPALTGENDTVFLEPVVLNGWNNIRQLHRDHVLNHKNEPEQEYYPQRLRVNVLRDTVLLPVSEYRWLLKDGIGICRLEQVKEGCCRIVGQDDECSERYTYEDPMQNRLEAMLARETQGEQDAQGEQETQSTRKGSENSKNLGDSESSAPSGSIATIDSIDSNNNKENSESSESSEPSDSSKNSGAAGAGAGLAGTGVAAGAKSSSSGLLVQPRIPAALQLTTPIVSPMEKYVPFSEKMIMTKDSDALYVYFQLDSIRLRRDFRDNALTLDSIIGIVTALMEDTLSELRVIQVVGVASIEGNEKHNIWLAGERAKALKQYIQDNVPYPLHDSLFNVGNGGEAWADLRYQVEQSTMQGRAGILHFIDTESDPAKREKLIRGYQCGTPYKWIVEHLLADLRNSGYIRVFYTVAPDAAGQTINKAIAMMGEKRYMEAEELLQTVKNDERAWFPLGIALYMNGQEAEGEELWEKAAALGNEEAIRTLKEFRNEN